MEYAKGGIIGRVRIIGDRMDPCETWIPLAPGVRTPAILQRTINGPAEEERAVIAEKLVEQSQAEAVDRRQRKIRHMALVSMHDGILRRLLEEHAPHERETYGGHVAEECHGCTEGHDSEHGEYFQPWPCPTWQTISDATP